MIKDKDIRFKYILENKDFFKKGIFINEYKINKETIVDFALFYQDELYGFEIKSEADNLKRLPNQLRNYLKFFDYIYIIVHDEHKRECIEILNKFKLNKIGVISVDTNIEFNIYRKPLGLNKMMKLNNVINNIKLNQLEVNHHELLHGKLNLDEAILLLKENLINNYNKECPFCKSNLVYKTSYKTNETIKDIQKSNNIYKYIEIVKNITYKTKSFKCIECNKNFNIIDKKKEKEKIISRKEKDI